MSFLVGATDMAGSLARFPLALKLAGDDVHGRYRRTVLGPLWITLGQAAGIFGMTLVFAGLFGQDPRVFILYLAAGFPVWAMLSSYLSDTPTAFIQAKPWIEAYEMPWTLHILRRSLGYVLVLFHQLITLFVLMLVLNVPFSAQMLWAIPALFVVFVTGTSIGVVLAVLGARFRDLQPAMTVITSFMFVFTPIFWDRASLTSNTFVVHYNPLYYYVEVIRSPLLGRPIEAQVWIVTIIGAMVCLAAAVVAFSTGRKRLYHWM